MLMDQAPTLSSGVPMQVRVMGPDCAGLTQTDLRRLFRGRRLTPARRVRLANSGRVVAACGNRIVGVAAYDRTDVELRVHEFGIDSLSPCSARQVALALLEALEVACLAGGGRRLVLLPRTSVEPDLLGERGFVPIAADCAGSWHEKLFPS